MLTHLSLLAVGCYKHCRNQTEMWHVIWKVKTKSIKYMLISNAINSCTIQDQLHSNPCDYQYKLTALT